MQARIELENGKSILNIVCILYNKNNYLRSNINL